MTVPRFATPNVTRRATPRTLMLLLLTALMAVSVVSLLIGAGSVGPLRALAMLVGEHDSEARFVIWELRRATGSRQEKPASICLI